MKKAFLISIVTLLVFTSFSFGEAIIGADLQKALDNDRGEFQVIISMKENVDAKSIAAKHAVRSSSDLFGALKSECADKQHFVKELCKSLEAKGNMNNVTSFFLANAMSATCSADAVRELAMQSDIYSITLDAEQQMINPIASTERATAGAWGVDYINTKAAHAAGGKGQGVIVAVIDTGIDADHSAFSAGQILTDKCVSFVAGQKVEDGNGHGTHCAGSVASVKYGVAHEAKIIGVKVLSDSGSGSWNGVMKGVEYAAQHADVLSMSLGGRASASGNVVETAVKNAVAAGKIVVIAAGNSGPWGRTIGTPGVTEEAITVGAIDKTGKLARFSSRGPTVYGTVKPDIVAPGVNIESAWKKGGVRTISGTSMATPHVAGLVACYISKFKGAKSAAVKARLMNTAFGTKKDNEYGQGCVTGQSLKSNDIVQLDLERASKTITFKTDAKGSVVKNVEIELPLEIKVKGFKVSHGFGNVNVVINGETILNQALQGGQKVDFKHTLKSGKNIININATAGAVKGGECTGTLYYSLWK